MRKSTHSGEYALLRATLAQMRATAGLSQRGLAEKLLVPHSWIAKVESGERRLDLVEFGWFCEACGKDPGRAAQALFAKVQGHAPIAQNGQRTAPSRYSGRRGRP